MNKKEKLLIFIVAYHAEKTLEWVLNRIPRQIFNQFDCEVLIVDDASNDQTHSIGRMWGLKNCSIKVTALRNQYNQGYGGNQKIGYQFAINNNFDFVAMIHGDGQYAPEELPNLIVPLNEGDADAVFGSRMFYKTNALKGGMPLYKFFGNRILTALQNLMLGSRLTEFHSGYRLYRVKALSKIPFQLNSNDFYFDTEIINQLMNARSRIVELPIPTYYGDEICRVNGIKYGWQVLGATFHNVLHRVGLLYQRRYDTGNVENRYYTIKLGFVSSHTRVIESVPEGATVYDIGSGPGGVANELQKKNCNVTVVDFYPAKPIKGVTVITQDLNRDLKFDLKGTTHILLMDIIEHLNSPEDFLIRLRAKFTHNPKTLLLTTPNICFLPVRLMMLFGQFNYGKAGILDKTHTRLFTFRSIRYLLNDFGFRIKKIEGIPAPFPKAFGDNIISRTLIKINIFLIKISKSLFSYQIFLIAETTPDVNFILKDSLSKGAHNYGN